MNAIIPQNFGALSAKFAAVPAENDLSAGVQAGFGIIGYKGKAWSTRYRGTETILMRPDGDGQRNSIEVVILKASVHVSKIWYENGFVEGSSSPPDCFSTNGVTPDGGSQKKQATTCALCPKNQWGSRITPQGKQGKACSDSKRMAVTPMGDIANEAMGGPMLLRVPAASLRDLAAYGEKMQALGYPYYAIGTRISFDPQEAYPKFVFGAIRPLTDQEADAVLAARDSRQVTTILAEGSEMGAQPVPVQPLASAFEQPPVTPSPAPALRPQTVPDAPVAAKPVAPPAPVAIGFGGAEPAATTPAPVQVYGGSAPAEVAKQPVPPAPTVVTTAAPATAPSNFEDELDAQLNALLPDVA